MLLLIILICVCWGFLTFRSQHGSTYVLFKRRQIVLVWMWLDGGGRGESQNPVMIWLFCAAEHRGEALGEARCWYVFESVVFLLVARTIMGPHGINRAVQRLEFCDCKKGLGEHLPPDLSDLWISVIIISFVCKLQLSVYKQCTETDQLF